MLSASCAATRRARGKLIAVRDDSEAAAAAVVRAVNGK
jgi:hypothetical protein